jgi:solute carrier family 10 (sodium/bile acid cotransporter), member 7
LLSLLKRQWFLLLIAAAVAAGILCHGPMAALNRDQKWMVKAIVVIAMLLNAFTMKGGDIVASALLWKAHIVALAASYVLLPALLFCAARCATSDPQMAAAFAIVGAVPCTLASNAIWTRLAGGNDALALTMTVLSNVLNFVIGPLVLLVTVGQEVSVPAAKIGLDLLITVALPVVVGQLVRLKFAAVAERGQGVISVAIRGCILAIVVIGVSVAADAAEKQRETAPESASEESGASPMLTAPKILIALAGLGIAHSLTLVGAYAGGRALRLSRPDRIAAMFSGAQKTLLVGMSLATSFFADQPLAPIGIILYHPLQLVIDTVAVEWMRRKGK